MNRKDASARLSVDAGAATAAEWVMRLDRGLSPDEQDRYLQWLAADPHHAVAMAKQQRAWEAFDRLAGLQLSVQAMPDPDLLAPTAAAKPGVWRLFVWALLPLAAAVVIILSLWRHPVFPAAVRPPAMTIAQLDPIEERGFEDGSMIRLNRGAVITVEFTATERRVSLQKGEASFDVARDLGRPFVVLSAGVQVRAVGTAFNVRLGERAVDVIVTEGRVLVAGAVVPVGSASPTLDAGQRAVVPLLPADGPPAVSTPSAEELARRLAWQPRLLTFTDEPLAVLLNEFNRHNPVVLRTDDPALQGLRLSARLRSDNVQGFLRLLESDFGVRAHFQPGGEVVLQSAR